MVIENHPRLEDGTPFPTTFWLTCPLLVKRAGTLEAAGWMRQLTMELQSSPGLKDRLGSANARYSERRASLGESDGSSIPGGGPDRVKCLHAHLAHELAAGPNPVGARTLARTGWPDCVRACVDILEGG
jgi:uncharacterized protein